MWPESSEQAQPLRTGLTTGSCATACAMAAAHSLLLQRETDTVTITLPAKPQRKQSSESLANQSSSHSPNQSSKQEHDAKQVEMTITRYEHTGSGVKTSTIKDAGDDPDATHGACIWVEVQLIADNGAIEFVAGQGVGTVTREGLVLAVGEAAINPVPRKMITEHLLQVAAAAEYEGGFRVIVGVEKGEEIALKTMNGRLGILGGLSILGTTGIVRPYSCAAWIASIHQGIDVAKANGMTHIAASTGNASEAAIAGHYQLEDMALIEMGDFAGAVLKHLRKQPVAKLSICGGFGKITKLANRHMDLNSRVSSVDFEQIARVAKQAGADDALQQAVSEANTSIQAFNLCAEQGVDLAAAMCREAREFARDMLPENIDVEVWAVDRQGRFIGRSGWQGEATLPDSLFTHEVSG